MRMVVVFPAPFGPRKARASASSTRTQNPAARRPSAPRPGRPRPALGRIADGVLESPDLPSLTRLLTEDLPRALEARDGTLLLWDRRLESFEGLGLADGGRLVTFRPEGAGAGGPQAAGG